MSGRALPRPQGSHKPPISARNPSDIERRRREIWNAEKEKSRSQVRRTSRGRRRASAHTGKWESQFSASLKVNESENQSSKNCSGEKKSPGGDLFWVIEDHSDQEIPKPRSSPVPEPPVFINPQPRLRPTSAFGDQGSVAHPKPPPPEASDSDDEAKGKGGNESERQDKALHDTDDDLDRLLRIQYRPSIVDSLYDTFEQVRQEGAILKERGRGLRGGCRCPSASKKGKKELGIVTEPEKALEDIEEAVRRAKLAQRVCDATRRRKLAAPADAKARNLALSRARSQAAAAVRAALERQKKHSAVSTWL